MEVVPIAPAIRLENVSVRYGEREVLRDVSLHAHRGEVVTLLGRSGCGKSTLLRTVNMLRVPDSGRVYLGSELIRTGVGRRGPIALDHRQIRRIRTKCGMVFQAGALWQHLTALENVALAPREVLRHTPHAATERALAELARVGMADRAKALPCQLSGGQQQRVAFARALAMDPEVLLLDEPTSSLDPENVAGVLTIIRDLATAERTMMLVTHEIGFAREVSDRTVFLNDGEVEEDGPTGDVLNSVPLQRFLDTAS